MFRRNVCFAKSWAVPSPAISLMTLLENRAMLSIGLLFESIAPQNSPPRQQRPSLSCAWWCISHLMGFLRWQAIYLGMTSLRDQHKAGDSHGISGACCLQTWSPSQQSLPRRGQRREQSGIIEGLPCKGCLLPGHITPFHIHTYRGASPEPGTTWLCHLCKIMDAIRTLPVCDLIKWMVR